MNFNGSLSDTNDDSRTFDVMTSHQPMLPLHREYRDTTRALLLFAVVALGIGVYWLVGCTDRAVYLGHDRGGGDAWLQTEPHLFLSMPRDGDLARMRQGCVYDFTTAPNLGRRQTGRETRHVRSARLVSCPSG